MAYPKCSLCGKRALQAPITIAVGADTRFFYLCRTDSQPIMDVFKLGTVGPAAQANKANQGPQPRKHGYQGHQVIAIEDWKPGKRAKGS